jgi:hypothetical protein
MTALTPLSKNKKKKKKKSHIMHSINVPLTPALPAARLDRQAVHPIGLCFDTASLLLTTSPTYLRAALHNTDTRPCPIFFSTLPSAQLRIAAQARLHFH